MVRFYFVVNSNVSLIFQCSVSLKSPLSSSWKFGSIVKTMQCTWADCLDETLRNAIAVGLGNSSRNLILVDSVQIIRSKRRDNGLRVRRITSRRSYFWLVETVSSHLGLKFS